MNSFKNCSQSVVPSSLPLHILQFYTHPYSQLQKRFFTPSEVAQHNRPEDCWVSFLGEVYDLTKVVKANPGVLSEPILRAAGSDISHWFDDDTRDIRSWTNPVTNAQEYYTPQGRFVGVPPQGPVTGVDTTSDLPWWRNSVLKVGFLSKKTRTIRLKNILTQQVRSICDHRAGDCSYFYSFVHLMHWQEFR